MVPRQMTAIKSEHYVNLAFMECFTSCIMTYLNIKEKNYRKLLLEYWSISYQYKTLLSARNPRQLSLEYLYGVKLTFVKGDEPSLRQYIRSGKHAICLSTASKLSFFPSSFLGMEANGFQHSILIYGLDEQLNQYGVIDPVTNITTGLDAKELATASAVRQGSGEMHYFVLEEDPFMEPELRSCLLQSTAKNLKLYMKGSKPKHAVSEQSSDQEKAAAWQEWFSSRHSGIYALELFEEDLIRASDWNVQRRNDWIVMNTKTILSIRNIRNQIWNAYRELAGFSEMQLEEGQRQIKAILASWNTLNFLLLKYKTLQSNHAVIPSIRQCVQELKRSELQFLEWLHQAVRE